MKQALDRGEKVCYVDETGFNKYTLPRLEYASKGRNVSFTDKVWYTPPLSVVAAISADVGVEMVYINDAYIVAEPFIEFLEKLRAVNGEARVHLFMDCLSIHK